MPILSLFIFFLKTEVLLCLVHIRYFTLSHGPGSLGGGQEFQNQPGQHGEIPSLLKISQAWWHRPVVLATLEAEAGGSLEHGRLVQ